MFYAPDVELPLAPEAEAEAQGAAVGSTSVSGETLAELQTAYNALLTGEGEEDETTDNSTGGGLDGILDKVLSSMESLKTYAVPAVGVVVAVGIVGLVWSRGSKKSKDKTTIAELLSATVDIKDD
jgi:hypothetical protein